MSDEQLKLELEQCKNQITGMNANLAAAKDMISENLNAILTLKTNLALYQDSHTQLVKTNSEILKDNERLRAQVAVLAAKVLELQPKEDNVTLDHLVPETLDEVQEVKVTCEHIDQGQSEALVQEDAA